MVTAPDQILPGNEDNQILKDMLTLTQVCRALSISAATGRNWVRLGKLTPALYSTHRTPLFAASDISEMKASILDGSVPALKSRRNKKYISGNGTVSSYPVTDSSCFAEISSLVQSLSRVPSDAELRLFLCDCALQLMEQAGMVLSSMSVRLLTCSFSENCCSFLELQARISGLYQDTLHINPPAYHYVRGEDTLGLLYMSLQNIGNRKATGSYYTPARIIDELLEHLPPVSAGASRRLIDPSCGTGSFLMHLPAHFTLTDIYGCDIDPIAIAIARINLALHFGVHDSADIQTICHNLFVADWLLPAIPEDIPAVRYDYIIGNPPWGYDFTARMHADLSVRYQCANTARPESYDLFLERSLKCLQPEGILSFVLPEAVLQVKSHQNIRELICHTAHIRYLSYLGNAFCGVQCPSIILTLSAGEASASAPDISVHLQERFFSVSAQRRLCADNFHLLCNDQEYQLLQKLSNFPGICTLKGNADFALGIVTGDNHHLLSLKQTASAEPVLRGSNIFRYRITPAAEYICFEPSRLQQCAPEHFYRAPEKLFYRFISDQLVFAYDHEQLLSLNSCNIVIPHLPGMKMQYVMAILNSRILQFFYSHTFHSLKVLRSALEILPIPPCSIRCQQDIINLTELLCTADSAAEKISCYNRIDRIISSLFHLSEEEYRTIINATFSGSLYLDP